MEGFRAPSSPYSEFYQQLTEFVQTHDLSVPENYDAFCSKINIDGLIDWYLFESYAANTDSMGNLRYYRSPENGNRWDLVFFDLDLAYHYWEGNFNIIINGIGNSGYEMPLFINNLVKNDTFRDKLLSRYAELTRTVLSDEYVIECIEKYENLLRPELARDRERWGLKFAAWEEHSEALKDLLRTGYADKTIDELCHQLYLTDEQKAAYFG